MKPPKYKQMCRLTSQEDTNQGRQTDRNNQPGVHGVTRNVRRAGNVGQRELIRQGDITLHIAGRYLSTISRRRFSDRFEG